MNGLRPDLALVAGLVPEGASVLDVGCGDGALMAHLRDAKRADVRGIELSAGGVSAAVARGLSVVQGDADTDLASFPSGSVDYAVLSQTLQATRAPDRVLAELLRIGRRAVVSFPNFGHWRVRWQVLRDGRMPTTRSLPSAWYATANIHLCTVADFRDLAAELRAAIEQEAYLSRGRRIAPPGANWRAEQAVFVLTRTA